MMNRRTQSATTLLHDMPQLLPPGHGFRRWLSLIEDDVRAYSKGQSSHRSCGLGCFAVGMDRTWLKSPHFSDDYLHYHRDLASFQVI